MENTVECNTPSDVEKDFKHFFAEDRIDALDIIENTISSTEESDLQARYLACLIFVVSICFQYIPGVVNSFWCSLHQALAVNLKPILTCAVM